MDAVPHITRTLVPFLARAVAQFPAVLLMEPRQPGKTTRLRHALADTYASVSLEASDAHLWHGSCIGTCLECDVRVPSRAGDLAQDQLFPETRAVRPGRLLILSDPRRDLGMAVSTAKRWLSVLEATFRVAVLRSCHA